MIKKFLIAAVAMVTLGTVIPHMPNKSTDTSATAATSNAKIEEKCVADVPIVMRCAIIRDDTMITAVTIITSCSVSSLQFMRI